MNDIRRFSLPGRSMTASPTWREPTGLIRTNVRFEMPRTIKSIVDNHRAAAERRSKGPVWDRTINVKEIIHRDQQGNTSEAHAAAVANEIAALIRLKVPESWLDVTNDDYDKTLFDIVESLECLKEDSYADDITNTSVLREVNFGINALYDWADCKRVWLGL